MSSIDRDEALAALGVVCGGVGCLHDVCTERRRIAQAIRALPNSIPAKGDEREAQLDDLNVRDMRSGYAPSDERAWGSVEELAGAMYDNIAGPTADDPEEIRAICRMCAEVAFQRSMAVGEEGIEAAARVVCDTMNMPLDLASDDARARLLDMMTRAVNAAIKAGA